MLVLVQALVPVPEPGLVQALVLAQVQALELELVQGQVLERHNRRRLSRSTVSPPSPT